MFPTSKSDATVKYGETDRSVTINETRATSAKEEEEDLKEAEELSLKMLLSPSREILCTAVDEAVAQDIKAVAFSLRSVPSAPITKASTSSTSGSSGSSGSSAKHLEASTVLEDIQAVFNVNPDLAKLFEDLQLICTCEVLDEQLTLLEPDSGRDDSKATPSTDLSRLIQDRVYHDREAVIISMEKSSGSGMEKSSGSEMEKSGSGNGSQFSLDIQQALQGFAALLSNNPIIYIGTGKDPAATNAPIDPAVIRTPDVELSDTVVFEASYLSQPANLSLRLEATGTGLIKGSGSLSADKLGLRMRVEATPGLVGGGILEPMNYAARLTQKHSVDQWEWDEEWTHNSGRARQDMQDRSESRKRSSDVGLEDRRVAATVVSGRVNGPR